MSLHLMSNGQLLITVNNCAITYDMKSQDCVKIELSALDKDSDTKVQNSALSGDDKHVAVTTNKKELLLYAVDIAEDLKLDLLWTKPVSRVSHKVRFSPDFKRVLLADKTGDCFAYTVEDGGAMTRVCGHISMVMDLLLTKDNKHLISCDRDEKIRVTCFPDSHNIAAYCVGHKEYVSQIEILPQIPKILCSISGDQSLRFWDYVNGKELYSLPLPAGGVHMAVKSSSKASSTTIACSMYKSNFIQLYEVVYQNETKTLKMVSSKQIEAKCWKIKSILFQGDDLLTLTQCEKEGKTFFEVMLLRYNPETRSYDQVALENVNSKLAEESRQTETEEEQDDTSTWFKKKFDNLSEYHERKRKRVEMQNDKKNCQSVASV